MQDTGAGGVSSLRLVRGCSECMLWHVPHLTAHAVQQVHDVHVPLDLRWVVLIERDAGPLAGSWHVVDAGRPG